MISEDALREFKEICKEELGWEIPDEQAQELGINLLNLFNHIYRPVQKNWLNAISDTNLNNS